MGNFIKKNWKFKHFPWEIIVALAFNAMVLVIFIVYKVQPLQVDQPSEIVINISDFTLPEVKEMPVLDSGSAGENAGTTESLKVRQEKLAASAMKDFSPQVPEDAAVIGKTAAERLEELRRIEQGIRTFDGVSRLRSGLPAGALTYVGDEHIRLHNDRLSFSVPGTGIEFGGIAKGYIADRLKDLLRQDGVTSALIDLGGNILCLGNKPDGTAFRIGVRQPFSDRDAVIDTVAVKDLSVVSSGIYERCFKQNGKFYHHILDPSTGYPVDNTLMAVTILSKASVDGDGLSTTCFGLGLEKGMELIDSLDNVEAVFVTKDEKMHYSKGYAKYRAMQK